MIASICLITLITTTNYWESIVEWYVLQRDFKALKVNANIHAPLLCVTDVFDVASGDLSLPGKIN